MKRGDVVIVEFPYTDQQKTKKRPAVVIQADSYNAKLTTTVVAMISGNVAVASDPANVFVDPSNSNGQSSGLHGPSVIKCYNLFTISQNKVLRTIGKLSDALKQKLNACLKTALEIS